MNVPEELVVWILTLLGIQSIYRYGFPSTRELVYVMALLLLWHFFQHRGKAAEVEYY